MYGVAVNEHSPTDCLGIIEYSSPKTLLLNVERPENMMHKETAAVDVF